jgi:hypothetical protein
MDDSKHDLENHYTIVARKLISLVHGAGRGRRYLEGAAIVVKLVFLLPGHAIPLLDLSGLGHVGKPKILPKKNRMQGSGFRCTRVRSMA